MYFQGIGRNSYPKVISLPVFYDFNSIELSLFNNDFLISFE